MYGSQQSSEELTSGYSWLCNFTFLKILITHVFGKQGKRLSLKTLFRIEFSLPFTSSRKVLAKIPGLF